MNSPVTLPLPRSIARRSFCFAALGLVSVALANWTSAAPAGSEVSNGIDVLVRERFETLRGLRIGLITNHTGHDRSGKATIDLLRAAPEVKLLKLFSPEHGIRGQLDERVKDSVDESTGLPVYSLYGATRMPTAEHLKDLDALVFDIQDIGCRFYTYISTMGNCMEAAAKAGLRFIVLDRVNPINGKNVEGPIRIGTGNFVAYHEIPLRHGMTVGELAQLFNEERGWKCSLTIVKIEGWRRDRWFDQTGLTWTNPSPNMRSLAAATLYPGVGVIEFTDISVGRGTATPFEHVGAPYLDGRALATSLTAEGMPGIRFEPTRFTPNASKFKDKECQGVRFIITDRDRFNSFDLGIALCRYLQRHHPEQFSLDKLNKLLFHPPTLELLKADKSLADIKAAWMPALREFDVRRAKHLLYP